MRGAAGSLAALAAGVLLSCALMVWVVGSFDGGVLWETTRLVLPLGAIWLVAAHAATRARRPGPLRVQYLLGMAGTLFFALLVVVYLSRAMFSEHHDVAVLVSFVAFAAVVGVRTATLLARRAACDVERLQAGIDAIADGDLERRIDESGPAEIASTARAANRMAERLAAARDELTAADAARRSLVAAVSHDLRTPLASLRVLVDGIQDGVISDPQEVDRALRRIGLHVRSLSALVDDLFELARLDAGDITWSLSQVAVDQLIDEAVEALRPEAEQKGLSLAEELALPLAPVHGNPEKLQRVLYNLVQNAVRHTPADGLVTLRATPDDRFVRIEVADDGEGMAPEDLDRAFERFWRGGDAAARPAGGAGLGLSICRAIVEAHGGRIWIEPGATRGTRVCVTLPAAP
jgi:two-component system, OmpR family, sensor histidine kinase SaeS